MDVTRDNFSDILPSISEAICQASFCAIDAEFTGLTDRSFNVTLFDSPEERYKKLSQNIKNFQLLQFGLSTFRYDSSTEKYKVDVFNIYIFPFPYACPGYPDRIFSCQSSSIDFLINQNFDFNKVFKHGVPYLRLDEEDYVSAKLKQKQELRENDSNTNTISIDEETKVFVEKVSEQVKNFLANSDQTELLLAPCNSFLRKVLFERIPMEFPNLVSLESCNNEETKQRQILVRRGNDDLFKKAKLEEMKLQEEEKFQNAIGFSKIIKLLTESNIPVVGHNMLLDLLFTINQFVAKLPQNLSEFKTLVQSVFPKLVDTKLMGSLLPFKELLSSTVLGDLYKQLTAAPFCSLPLDAPEKYKTDEGLQTTLLHEAGYDAFITGCSFLSMFCYLQKLQKSENPFDRTSFELISPYINKVFLMKTLDLPYLNLAGLDLKPNREHVFHVTFPRAWKSADLRQLFSPFGNVMISWINEFSGFVCLQHSDQAKNVRDMMLLERSAEPSPYQIISYADYCSAKESSQQSEPSVNSKISSVTSNVSGNTMSTSKTNLKRSIAATNKPINVDKGLQTPVKKTKLPDKDDKQLDEPSSEKLKKENTNKSMLFDVPVEW